MVVFYFIYDLCNKSLQLNIFSIQVMLRIFCNLSYYAMCDFINEEFLNCEIEIRTFRELHKLRNSCKLVIFQKFVRIWEYLINRFLGKQNYYPFIGVMEYLSVKMITMMSPHQSLPNFLQIICLDSFSNGLKQLIYI